MLVLAQPLRHHFRERGGRPDLVLLSRKQQNRPLDLLHWNTGRLHEALIGEVACMHREQRGWDMRDPTPEETQCYPRRIVVRHERDGLSLPGPRGAFVLHIPPLIHDATGHIPDHRFHCGKRRSQQQRQFAPLGDPDHRQPGRLELLLLAHPRERRGEVFQRNLHERLGQRLHSVIGESQGGIAVRGQ